MKNWNIMPQLYETEWKENFIRIDMRKTVQIKQIARLSN
jgi:hypothetical protein